MRKIYELLVAAIALFFALLAGSLSVYAQGTEYGKGIVTQRSTVNMSAIAAEEEKQGKRPRVESEEAREPEPVTLMPMPRPVVDLNLRRGDTSKTMNDLRTPESEFKEKHGPRVMAASPPLSANFAAIMDSSVGSSAADLFRIPPDTHGAAGPNHLMTTLNTHIRIHTKAGATVSTVSLNSFWSTLTANVAGVPVAPSCFDPKVLYDHMSNRWMITTIADANSANSSVLIGVTQSNDPTGTWNLFRVDADPGDTTWADFPSIGFNKDWIVIQVNMFRNSNNVFVRSQIYVFKKADLYSNTAATNTLIKPNPTKGYFTQSPNATFDNTLNVIYLVETLTGNSGGNGVLRLSKISGAVGSETFSDVGSVVATAAAWADIPAGGNDFAPQLGDTSKIQNNDSRMQNSVYRNGKIWCTHTVFLPAVASPSRSAAQWWQINPDSTVAQRGRVEDSANGLFFAFPSIAVNSSDNVLLGFSRFSSRQFASGNYAYRANTDAANTMRDNAVLKAGEAKYEKRGNGTKNRWGDYSMSSVDPVDDCIMWTIQEYAATPGKYVNPASDITNNYDKWGTWWGKLGCIAADQRLPVELSSFDLASSNSHVTVEWQTASEVNNAGFEIHRAAESDQIYNLIASYKSDPNLAGLGTTSQGKGYEYVDGEDGSLTPGAVYLYKLVDVTIDGIRTEHDSKSILVDGGAGSIYYESFYVNPISVNPGSESVSLSFRLPEAAEVSVEVYSVTGQLISTPIDAQEFTAGDHSQPVSVAGVPSGTYLLRVTSGRNTRTRPFMVIR